MDTLTGNSITVRYEPEDSYHGELHAVARSRCYAGYGSAWFNLETLREFAESIRTYPLAEVDAPHLKGGQGGTPQSFPETVTLLLRLSPISGRVSVDLHLAVVGGQMLQAREPDFSQETRFQFFTNHGEVEAFRRQILKVLEGTASEARLLQR
jgi:hypothetical protein